MSTSDKLVRLIETKNAIKDAIVEKGVAVTDTDTFRSYADKIGEIECSSPSPTPYPLYYPPSDWANIDDVTNQQIKFLVADIPFLEQDGNPSLEFLLVGTDFDVIINWGDGTTVHTSPTGTTVGHVYTKGAGVPCSRGYTVFTVTITVLSGALRAFQWSTGSILSMAVGITTLSMLSSFAFNDATGITCLESVKFFGTMNSVTSMSNAFRGCSNLSQVLFLNPLPICASLDYAFYQCRCLKSIATLDVPSVATMQAAFYQCGILIDTPILGFSNVTNMNITFSANYALYKHIDLSSATGLTKITASVCFMLSGLLVSAAAPWSGSSPQIDVNGSGLDANALNALFDSLGNVSGKTIRITSAAGEWMCDPTIATNKGWTVI